MKRLALALLVACGGHAAPAPVATSASARPSPKLEAPVENDEARARAFVAALAKHDFAAAFARFDEKMRAAMPEAKLGEIWSAIEAQAGPLKSVDGVDVKEAGDVRVAAAKVSFEKAPLVLRVVFAKDGRVTGFFVAPGEAKSTWEPPPYAKPDAFEERRVSIGAHPALPGTLTMPKGAKKVPIVVLVHGSGPHDEDETIGPNKPFKDLAFGLASRGVAVLRYEKRTHVDPTGVRTQKEEVEDGAHAAIALARSQPEVDPSRVILLGHSQGGYLAPRIAKADPAIKRLVILAGATRPLEESIVAQLRYLASLQPNDPKVRDAVAAAEKFKAAAESPSLKPTDSVDNPLGAPVPGAYFLDVRGYHPERVAARLAIPILVLQGEHDYQVTVADDFAAWKSALAHDKRATLRTYPGLMHTFVRAGDGPPAPADYLQPGHVDEKVIDDIASFALAP